VIEEQALRVVMEYEHKKSGKTLSKGYSFGDWIGFTHVVQIKPDREMYENIFDQTGNLISSGTYRGFSFVMRKITQFIIKRR